VGVWRTWGGTGAHSPGMRVTAREANVCTSVSPSPGMLEKNTEFCDESGEHATGTLKICPPRPLSLVLCGCQLPTIGGRHFHHSSHFFRKHAGRQIERSARRYFLLGPPCRLWHHGAGAARREDGRLDLRLIGYIESFPGAIIGHGAHGISWSSELHIHSRRWHFPLFSR
jgi:hypothetical protein